MDAVSDFDHSLPFISDLVIINSSGVSYTSIYLDGTVTLSYNLLGPYLITHLRLLTLIIISPHGLGLGLLFPFTSMFYQFIRSLTQLLSIYLDGTVA